MKFVFDQLRFSFGTYLEARLFGHESLFTDWALTCVYLGGAFGTIISGVLIKRYRRFKPFLQANIVVDLIIYLCFALGWMHVEQSIFAPALAFIGATEGFAEGLWLVALLSLVDTKDQPLLYAFFGLPKYPARQHPNSATAERRHQMRNGSRQVQLYSRGSTRY